MQDVLLHAFVTLFVVIDPIGQVVFFIGVTRGDTEAHRRTMALRGTLVATLILFPFAFGGNAFLHALGISLPALEIAGGALLFLLSIDMLFARESGLRSTTGQEREEATQREDISIFPLAIPLIAGPGALTSVALLVAQNEGRPLYIAGILVVLGVVMGITLLALLLAGRIMGLLGVTGANVIGRVLGIVLAALAVQFIVNGIRVAFLLG